MGDSADLREFIREQTLLSDRRFERFTRELDRQHEAMRRHHDRQDRKLDDLLAESRAQRAALFKMMDRLDNGGAAAAG